MLTKNPGRNKKLVLNLLAEKPAARAGSLNDLAKKVLAKRRRIVNLAKNHQTPFYIYDRPEARNSILEFKAAFSNAIPGCRTYYALKANHHDLLITDAVQAGLGLDVSSARELKIALKHGAKRIVFSGPGKSGEELKLAVKNRSRVILHLDSFTELKNLGRLIKAGQKITCGVRVTTSYHGSWRKFGIPLADLKKFWQLSKKYPGLELAGIQCHTSFNQSADNYQKMIAEIAGYLEKNFSLAMLKEIEFFDFGGGFYPSMVEADYPWEQDAGRIIKIAREHYDLPDDFSDKYYPTKSATPAEFAAGIATALNKYLAPLVSCEYFCEPGRIIANNCLHIALRVADIKADGQAILDGGINLIGVWEKYEDFYCPVVNLTRPARKEIKFTLFGNLCTPYDIWGYYCYAKKIAIDDLIIVPFQGAYTYSFANEFIKPIPLTRILK